MIKNLVCYSGAAEYSVDLHVIEMGISKSKVMFFTVTKLDGVDYTVILNGLPRLKEFKIICGRDFEVAQLIIKALKEDGLKYVLKYWFFDKDEWENELNKLLKNFKKTLER